MTALKPHFLHFFILKIDPKKIQWHIGEEFFHHAKFGLNLRLQTPQCITMTPEKRTHLPVTTMTLLKKAFTCHNHDTTEKRTHLPVSTMTLPK